MKIFITGGTGFIGSAVIEELKRKNHEIIGLARSETLAAKLTKAGCKVVKGSLTDLDVISETAKQCDAVLHLAAIHDFTNFDKSLAIDKAVIETICAALQGTNKTFINSALTMIARGVVVNDSTEVQLTENISRFNNDHLGLSYAEKGVRAMTIRLPPTVHGENDKAFITMIKDKGSELGFLPYADDGLNVWPAVHRLDAAKLYVLALEKGTSGTGYLAVAEGRIPTKDICETLSKKYNIPTKSVPAQEMLGFGLIHMLFGFNHPVETSRAKEELGWEPTNPGLLDDIVNYY